MTHRIAQPPANDVPELVACALAGMSDLLAMLPDVREVRPERAGKRLTGDMLAVADGLQQLAVLRRHPNGDARLIARLRRAVSDGLDAVFLNSKVHALAGLSADGTILVSSSPNVPRHAMCRCTGERARAGCASA
jgi:hypothetical protein